MSSEAKALSPNDQFVLSALFDMKPDSTNGFKDPGQVVVDINKYPDLHIIDITRLEQLSNREKEAIFMAESKKDYDKSLEIFDSLIDEEPLYASAYNNRAQLRRMEKMLQSGHTAGVNQIQSDDEIIADLKRAIFLTEPAEKSRVVTVSKRQASILAQAYSQLGALYLSRIKQLDLERDTQACGTLSTSKTRDPNAQPNEKWELQERASQCLYLGGLYGNEVARAAAVKVNPYAKLCGSIVREALLQDFAV